MQFSLPRRSLIASCVLAATLASAARADTITLADGKTFDNVTILTETLKEVSFKQDGKNKTVPSETVASIQYKKKPKLVDQADSSANEGDINGALTVLEIYVGGLIDGSGKESMAWAPAYAMQRLVELNGSIGDAEGVIEAANRLIANAKDSRYLPGAYLSKASALYDGKQVPEALAAIAELRKLIETQNLSQRWKLEVDLAEALADSSLSASKRRARVIEIAGLAGKDFPTVASRARVAEGESYIEGENKDFAKAIAIFRALTADPTADAPTLAGAYTGLGDCLFSAAIDLQKANQNSTAAFTETVDTYMRVVVLYPEQVRYRAKSMYLAARAFEFLGDETSKTRARGLYRSVIREYKESTWAGEARKQMGI